MVTAASLIISSARPAIAIEKPMDVKARHNLKETQYTVSAPYPIKKPPEGLRLMLERLSKSIAAYRLGDRRFMLMLKNT